MKVAWTETLYKGPVIIYDWGGGSESNDFLRDLFNVIIFWTCYQG